MSLESILNDSRFIKSVGEVSMPRMYPPRLSPEQAVMLDWPTFRDGLQPMKSLHLTEGLEVAVVDKTSLWAPSDVCCFFGGGQDYFTIEDFSDDEGRAFLGFHRDLVRSVQDIGNIHRDQYATLHVAFGFNPEDFQLGAHSIKRLHSHIFTPYHWITDGRTGSDPLRKEVAWKNLSWFNRLKFFEPFSCLYFDFLQEWLRKVQQSTNLPFQLRIEQQQGFVSLFFQDGDMFPDFFPILQTMYHDLHTAYTAIEALFTGRTVDPQTERFIPYSEVERVENVQRFLLASEWLSDQSRRLLKYTANHLLPASEREPGRITSASQAWFTKGFAGTFMFSFDRSSEVRLDLFPRVLSTSGVERAVYGLSRPTLIQREERAPTPYENFENEKFLLAVKSALPKS